MRRAAGRGISLGMTVAVVALILLLAFSLAATQLNFVNFTTRVENSQRALNLAESAVSMAIAELLMDPELGSSREAGTRIEIGHAFGPVLNRGWVTFEPGEAYSTNNLQGDAAVPGWDGAVVGPACAHLVGTGECRGVRKVVEVLLHVPQFPYAAASSGTISTSGEVLIAGVGSPEEIDQSPEWMPGDLMAGSSDPVSVLLDAGTTVTGTVEARGGIRQNGTVLGELRPFSDPPALPKLEVAAYDPERTGNLGTRRLAQSSLVAPALTGFVRREGDLWVRGGLTLDGAVVYVQGSLHVEGGISGKGAVFATGDVSVVGSSSLATDNLAALVSGGQVEVIGDDTGDSFFRGLIYGEGDIYARDISILGSVIGNGPGPGSRLVLERARLIHVPQYAVLRLELEDPLGTPFFFSQHGGKFLDAAVGTEEGREVQGDRIIYVKALEDGTYSLADPVTGVSARGLTTLGVIEHMRTSLTLSDDGPLDLFEAELDDVREELRILAELARSQGSPGSPGVHSFVLDPGRFLSLKDRIRVRYWLEH